MGFLNTFHQCFKGIVPGISRKILIKPAYREIFETARNIAKTRRDTPEKLTPEYLNGAINKTYNKLNEVFFSRLSKKIKKFSQEEISTLKDFEKIIRSLELPVEIHRYADSGKKSKKSEFSMREFQDGLSFPFLASAVIYAATFTGTTVMNNSRPLLDEMSRKLKRHTQPKRVLWLTDTFGDKNGVAQSLKHIHAEIKARNLPIDILAVGSDLAPDDHLIVLQPKYEFTFPFYEHQPFRIPDVMQIHKIFDEGSYDRLVCSTEGPMSLISILLKKAFCIPAWFFLHTDWLSFARKNLGSDTHMENRFRRILRALYRQFDNIFVLNGDQEKWLSGKEMGIDKNHIFKTAHWADEIFKVQKPQPESILGTNKNEKVLLYVGRISHEKGVMDLPYIYNGVKKNFPGLRLVAVGSGPAESELKEKIPDLIHIPWVDHKKLPAIYSSSDLMILPSTFDTFGMVVIEAMSCGLPVAAYDIMGPGEIIENGISGHLAKNKKGLTEMVINHFKNAKDMEQMRRNALTRAGKYQKDLIVKQMMKDLDIAS
jgi:glycosyltransferase involved in cell wall biosynthesis